MFHKAPGKKDERILFFQIKSKRLETKQNVVRDWDTCDRRFGGCDADWSYAACEWNVIDGWIL
jgi:hypothetical protein